MHLLQEVDVLVGVQSHNFSVALLFLRQNASVVEFVPNTWSPLTQRTSRHSNRPFVARSAAQVLHLRYTNLTFDAQSKLSPDVQPLLSLRNFMLQTRDGMSKYLKSISQRNELVA